jgi:tetratricopeptide (TPR) repeat protein
MRLCAEKLGSSSRNEENIVRNGMINPGKIFSWMIPVHLRESSKGTESYEKILGEVYKWVTHHISDQSFFKEIVDFLSIKIETATNDDEISRLYSIKGHFLLADSYLRLDNRELLILADNCYENSDKSKAAGCRSSSLRGRAEINFILGNYDDALEYSDKSIKCDPSYPYAYVTKGVIEWHNREYSEAIKLFSMAIDQYLGMVTVRKPSTEVMQLIEEKISSILLNQSDEIDSRNEFRAWILSSYYYGYCPFHPKETSYFNIQKRKTGNYLRVCHTLAKGEGDRKFLDCHSLINRNQNGF